MYGLTVKDVLDAVAIISWNPEEDFLDVKVSLGVNLPKILKHFL